jgi:hypothetical protein
MRKRPAIIILAICCLAAIACKQETKDDFLGVYKISKTVPLASTPSHGKETSNWKIWLQENDNFSLIGPGASNGYMGYWTMEKGENKKYKLMFSSAGHKAYAGFDGTTIYFDRPQWLLDSLFQEVSFEFAKD